MHRFYVPGAANDGPLLVLNEREAHHATAVLRLSRGDEAMVLDGVGGKFRCRIRDCVRKRVALEVVEKTSTAPPPAQVTLFQAIPKGRILEDIIEKATELGAARIVPVLSERVVTRIAPQDVPGRTEKWQQVAIEAMKQSGNPWLPKVEPPAPISSVLGRPAIADLTLAGSLQLGSQHPRIYFAAYEKETGRRPASVAVWIGPEGDFAPAEMAAICAAGAQPITLGPLVLRVETASTYCLSIINHELTAPGHS